MLLSPGPAAIAADGAFSALATEIALRGLALHPGAGASACGSCNRDCPLGTGSAMRLAALPDANRGGVTSGEAVATGTGF